MCHNASVARPIGGYVALALAGEIANRYLFFTAVIPKSMASTYLAPKKGAA